MESLPLARYYRLMFLPGLLLAVVPSIIRAYLLSPLPGSQEGEEINLIYTVEGIVTWCVVLGVALMLLPIINSFMNGARRKRFGIAIFCVFLFGLLYLTNIRLSAERMFQEPRQKSFSAVAENKVPLNSLVIGVERNGVAKAYPMNYLVYHHKVQDTVGGDPVLVTYCSMCRTGRVFNPVVDGVYQTFRLVGARQYNALLEDASTGSWWYQATGMAAAGPQKGKKLESLPFEQMTLEAWIDQHPNTLVMQPDPTLAMNYPKAATYETVRGMEKDSATGKLIKWSMINWVVGVEQNGAAKAYDWHDLLSQRVVNDNVGNTPVVVALRNDTTNFHVWNRTVEGTALEFAADAAGRGIRDLATNSLWNWKGECVEGTYAGQRLQPLQAYQEYWHSWNTFHPKTEKYEGGQKL